MEIFPLITTKFVLQKPLNRLEKVATKYKVGSQKVQISGARSYEIADKLFWEELIRTHCKRDCRQVILSKFSVFSS